MITGTLIKSSVFLGHLTLLSDMFTKYCNQEIKCTNMDYLNDQL